MKTDQFKMVLFVKIERIPVLEDGRLFDELRRRMAAAKKDIKEDLHETEKRYGRFVEEAKFRNDYLKHIATLDTGSIVIMATLLQKSVQSSAGKLISLAAASLVISLMGVVVTQHFLASNLSDSVDDIRKIPTTYERLVYRISTIIALIGFVIGLSFLGIFVAYSMFN